MERKRLSLWLYLCFNPNLMEFSDCLSELSFSSNSSYSSYNSQYAEEISSRMINGWIESLTHLYPQDDIQTGIVYKADPQADPYVQHTPLHDSKTHAPCPMYSPLR